MRGYFSICFKGVAEKLGMNGERFTLTCRNIHISIHVIKNNLADKLRHYFVFIPGTCCRLKKAKRLGLKKTGDRMGKNIQESFLGSGSGPFMLHIAHVLYTY